MLRNKLLGLALSAWLAVPTALSIGILSSSAWAEDTPKVVRIAAVVYNIAGKTTYLNGAAVLKEGGLEKTLLDKGVKIEWVPASHSAVGPIINEGFASGKIDFASYGDLPPVILNASRPTVQLVSPWGRSGNSYLVVPAKSKAASIEDLKGKRIALHRGRPWEIAFANLVESKGLSFKDFKIVNVNPQVGAAALASGTVDGFFGLNDAHILEQRKVGRIIWSTKSAPPDWKLMGGLWASNDFIKKYPELTQTIVTAYVKTSYWTSQAANKGFVFGLEGKWGSGKSSMLALVLKRLRGMDGAKVAAVEFRPWLIGDRDQLLSALFEDLAKVDVDPAAKPA